MSIQRTFLAAAIANGASLTAALDLKLEHLVGIQMDAAWTAAALTFQVSFDGTTYGNMVDDAGAEVTVAAAAGVVIVFANTDRWRGVRSLKVRSGTSGVPVNQLANRTLQLICIP